MLPYSDDTPSFSPPVWVIFLIGLNILFFIMSSASGHEHYVRTIFAYGTIPARFHQAQDQPIQLDSDTEQYIRGLGVDQSEWPSPFITLLTAIFLHGGIIHLIGNMWFLWLFGDNVEDRLGKLIFPIFYIVAGVVAGLIHIALNFNSPVPAIGASGAIAGLMGAYIYMFPRARIATLINWGFYFTTVYIPSSLYLGIWFLLQLFGGFVSGGGTNIAVWAHVGGFLAGLLLAMLFHATGIITWYPGDRGYRDLFPQRSARTSPYPPLRRPKRYTWRE